MESGQAKPYEWIECNLSAHGQAYFEFSKVPHSYVAPHWHDAVEIISVLEGELHVEAEQREYELRAGNCIILNPFIAHSTLSLRGNTSLLLQIPVQAFTDCVDTFENRQLFCDPLSEDPAHRAHLARVTELLRQIMEQERSGDPAARLRSMSLLLELIYELYTNLSRRVSAAALGQSRKNQERLSAVLNYTAAHYSEPVTLEEVAGALHLQPSYFCHFFKKQTGMTYLNYLSEYRLAKIYHDLLATDIPLKRLLERHGFTNYKKFRQCFYERFQSTPGAVREAQRAGMKGEAAAQPAV